MYCTTVTRYTIYMKTSVQTLYDQYVEVFPQEREALEVVRIQLETRVPGAPGITDRRNFQRGHVTAGAIVVSLPSKKVLLIDHAVLHMRLQPGGHVEAEDESVLAAAYRECKEEAGISEETLRYIPLTEQNEELPFAISVQDIPPNTAKDEPRHYHYDFWYLFTVPDGTPVRTEEIAVSNPQWTPFTVFAESADFSRHAEKIDKLLATS